MRHGTRMAVVLEAILDSGFMVTVDLGSSTFWELDDEASREFIAHALNVGLATCGWILVASDEPIASIPVVGPRRRMDRVSVNDDHSRVMRGSVVELVFDDGSERVVVKDALAAYEDGVREVREVHVLRLPDDGTIRPLDLDSLG